MLQPAVCAARFVLPACLPWTDGSEPAVHLVGDERPGIEPLLMRLGGRPCRVRRGDYLFHCGAPFRTLYGVRAGSFKTVLLTLDGREQVIGFHLAGEVLGLASIGSEKCEADAIALEDGEVVEIPFQELGTAVHAEPALQRELLCLLAGEIQRNRQALLLLGTMRAEERLAAFLLDMSKRMAARGWSPTRFLLRMTREEIGSLLGLKLETVSRILSRLHAQGRISVRNRDIEILDMDALEAVLGHSEVRPEVLAA